MIPELRDDDPGRVNPQVLLAMLEVWGTVDTVFREFGSVRNPRASVGRIYRSWQEANRILAEPLDVLGEPEDPVEPERPRCPACGRRLLTNWIEVPVSGDVPPYPRVPGSLECPAGCAVTGRPHGEGGGAPGGAENEPEPRIRAS